MTVQYVIEWRSKSAKGSVDLIDGVLLQPAGAGSGVTHPTRIGRTVFCSTCDIGADAEGIVFDYGGANREANEEVGVFIGKMRLVPEQLAIAKEVAWWGEEDADWIMVPVTVQRVEGPVPGFTPAEMAAARMVSTMLKTVRDSRKPRVPSIKIKCTNLSPAEAVALMMELMEKQEHRCALTGLALELDGVGGDPEMRASLDRIDSDGHYTRKNLQVVCRFMNRWKGADDDGLVRRLLEALQGRATASPQV